MAAGGGKVSGDGLTGRQRAFIDAYVDCLNATEAARRAGYARPMQEGWRLLRNAEIRPALDAALAERTLPKNEVLTRFAAMARADIRDLFNFDDEGNMAGLRLHRDAPLHLIKSIVPTKYGDKIELHDQQYALTKLGEAYGIFRDRTADSLEAIAAAALAAQAALDRKLVPPDGDEGAAGVPGEPDADGSARPDA